MIFSNLHPEWVPSHQKIRNLIERNFLNIVESTSQSTQDNITVLRFHKEELKFENFNPNLDSNTVNINFGTTFIGDILGSRSLVKQKVEFDLGDYYSHLRGNRISFYKPCGSGIIIKKGSKAYAEYFPSINTINFLIDFADFESRYILPKDFSDAEIKSSGNDFLQEMFKHVGNELKAIIQTEAIKKEIARKSWKNGNTEIIAALQASLELEAEQTIITHKRKITESEARILDYRSKLAFNVREMIKMMKEIEFYTQNKSYAKDKLVKEMDLIKDFNLIEDVSIEGDILSVITKYIPIKIGNTIYTGNAYVIKININTINLEITSAINIGYKGYWTSTDPHPHVSSQPNSQCLGNLSEIIAELCSQRELYALIVMILEFLKTANTDDVAGKKVFNHMVLTEEKLERIMKSYEMGNLGDLFEISEEMVACRHCGSTHEMEMMTGATDDNGETVYICQNCTDFVDSENNYCPNGVDHDEDEPWDEDHDDEDEE